MQDHCSDIHHIVVKAFVVLVKFLSASIDVRAEMLFSCEVSNILARNVSCFLSRDLIAPLYMFLLDFDTIVITGRQLRWLWQTWSCILAP